MNKIKTNRDFYFSKKHLNYIVNNHLCNKTTRNFGNKQKGSHSKNSNQVKSKSKKCNNKNKKKIVIKYAYILIIQI